MGNSLQRKIIDPTKGVYLLGTTPPREGVADDKISAIADKLLSRLSPDEYDGLIVYDIQDESSRIAKPRPFKFRQTIDPRLYSQRLRELANVDLITYKSVAQRDEADFVAWLNQTQNEYELNNLVLVGSPSSVGDIKLSLNQAYNALADYNAAHDNNFFLGGVTIAERHAAKFNEHQRLAQKTAQGSQYFVSQAVYNAQATIDLLTSYSELCRIRNVQPKRIILTFAPCGGEQTLAFMNWLGISVPNSTQFRILSAQDALTESVNICCENLDKILQHARYLDIPLGLNIESLTNRKQEIDASVQLFRLQKQILEKHLNSIPAANVVNSLGTHCTPYDDINL